MMITMTGFSGISKAQVPAPKARFGAEKRSSGLVVPSGQAEVDNMQAIQRLYSVLMATVMNPVELTKATSNDTPITQRVNIINSLTQALSAVINLARVNNIQLQDYHKTLQELDQARGTSTGDLFQQQRLIR